MIFFASHQFSRHSAMPRSFLVKSKRTHLLSPSKDAFRQRCLSQRDAEVPAAGKDGRRREDATQLSSPIYGVKDFAAEAYLPWNRVAVRSHSDPTQDRWPSGMNISSVVCVCLCTPGLEILPQ